jgi:ubiquitin C-terminal hydrolase
LADATCLKTLKLIGKEKPQFVFSQQQDAHECLIWLLDWLHEEMKRDGSRQCNNPPTSSALLPSHRVSFPSTSIN